MKSNENSKIVMVHGNGGTTAEEFWYPETKYQLKRLDLHVVSETMPQNNIGPSDVWIKHMDEELEVDENTIVIGHSTGAVAAMRYAETHSIFGSVLVAASHTDLGIENERRSGYFDKPWDWEKIKANQKWIIQFASTNDRMIPIKESWHIRDQLGTEYYEGIHGHFQEIVFDGLVAAVKEKLEIEG